jgi:hypothetical protein
MPSQWREGVYLPPMKAAIFDAVKRNPGISPDRVIAKLDDKISLNVLRQHIHQLNGLLASTSVQISGSASRDTPRGHYRLVRQRVKATA